MRRFERSVRCIVLLLVTGVASQVRADGIEVPGWLFPVPPPAAPVAGSPDDAKPLGIPTSAHTYTIARINNPFQAPDWHPEDHVPLPSIVASGRAPEVFACAFCHTPTGQGRPENASLAGLSADYIREQLEDMRSGTRKAIGPADYLPIRNMVLSASHLSDADIAAAAEFFSKQSLSKRVDIVETRKIPKVIPAGWVYAKAQGDEEELGQRIIEITPDLTRHERRDDRMSYIAYVPTGSVRRGESIALTNDAARRCSTCHGADLKGGALGPAIAGRSPTTIARQLFAFRVGTRTGDRARLMEPIVAALNEADVIALAAYVSSLTP
jgi:cytochrome c553